MAGLSPLKYSPRWTTSPRELVKPTSGGRTLPTRSSTSTPWAWGGSFSAGPPAPEAPVGATSVGGAWASDTDAAIASPASALNHPRRWAALLLLWMGRGVVTGLLSLLGPLRSGLLRG